MGRLRIERPLAGVAEWAPHPHVWPVAPSCSHVLDKDLNCPVSLGPCEGTPDLSATSPVYFNPLLSLKRFSPNQRHVSAKRQCDVATWRRRTNTLEEEMLGNNPVELHLVVGLLSRP